jgi:hypothetical protein
MAISKNYVIICPNMSDRLLEISTSLLVNNQARPAPQVMARLIQDGLTEQTLYDAWEGLGNTPPVMDGTLTDLQGLLPFIHLESDALAEQATEDETLLFLARDAELFRDDFTLTHGKTIPNYLMPASQLLWESGDWQDSNLRQRFFGKYGMTKATIDGSERFTLVDSGFAGSIIKPVETTLDKAYNTSLRGTGKLAIKLACMFHDDRYELARIIRDQYEPKQIVPVGPELHPERVLPRATKLRADASVAEPDRIVRGPTALYAIALQLMPHMHGHFNDVVWQDGDAVATVEPVAFDIALDEIGNKTPVNMSYVNPLAALIVQRRVVTSALNRAG